MKLSIYTAVKNGISNDLHVEAMLRHHLPLADEIIVNEGYSTDSTLKAISRIDPKIKIFQTNWDRPEGLQWSVGFKDVARRACTGDWCILLDCDEFIPEWEFEPIRRHLSTTSDVMVPVRFLNFYANYKVFHADPQRVHWPDRKMIIHRNLPEIEIWGDASNVRLRGHDFSWDTSQQMFSVHHFGMVRDAAILRHKWWIQGRAISGRTTRIQPPRALFRLFPHDWKDPQYLGALQVYDGPYVEAVRKQPAEFVRDQMRMYDLCVSRRDDHDSDRLVRAS